MIQIICGVRSKYHKSKYLQNFDTTKNSRGAQTETWYTRGGVTIFYKVKKLKKQICIYKIS